MICARRVASARHLEICGLAYVQPQHGNRDRAAHTFQITDDTTSDFNDILFLNRIVHCGIKHAAEY